MKKFLVVAFMLLSFTSAKALEGVNVGVSIMAGVFEADGASEKFEGSHSISGVANVTKKSSAEGENAEGLFGVGSLFVEKTLSDKVAFGLDFVPYALESEEAVNTQNTGTTGNGVDSESANKVQVDFENLITLYAIAKGDTGVYGKVGYVQVDVVTNENLATGGSYGDTDLSGYTVALGYDKGLDDGKFIRLEANYMDLGGATLTNKNDATKKVSADGITGYGAKLSIGKSF